MQYICSKTGDEGNIYAARQGMRACNNNNMRNPIIKRCREGLFSLVVRASPALFFDSSVCVCPLNS